MTKAKADLLQGTLDLLILKALTLGPLHGWGISKRIRGMSRGVLEVNQGSLYPALHRLEDRGFVQTAWGVSDEGRRAKFYTLTSRVGDSSPTNRTAGTCSLSRCGTRSARAEDPDRK